ncbi:MAG: DUF507 family protein [Helicobacteraceae bacterium]|jgi:hypothetical protein|nr:DUF507 family protein [Helicobacteraceae bacterium]
MRLLSEHVRFIAEKIARELATSKLVSLTHGDEPVIGAAIKRLEEEVKLERAVDNEVNNIMDELEDCEDPLLALKNPEDLEKSELKNLDWLIHNFDSKKLFWLIKRRVAAKEGLILDNDDRFSNLAHRILDDLYEEDLIDYSVSENLVKNLISKAILDYGRRREEIEEKVREKLKSYKRNIVRGTDEYDILFARHYAEELKKLGL